MTSTTSTDAIQWVKDNKKIIIQKFADLSIYLPVQNPTTYFMAGSPGAGKTEYSKSFIKELLEKEPRRKIVRIDADEVRDMLPQYNRTNATEMGEASGLGVAKLFDYVHEKKQDALIDSTFTPYEVALRNINRAVGKGRKIAIFYIYQDPIIAWDFTKKREKLEGRPIPKSFFIQSFFEAKENVNKIKVEFGKTIQLNLIKKKSDNLGVEKTFFNIDNVDSHLKIEYTTQSLEELLQ